MAEKTVRTDFTDLVVARRAELGISTRTLARLSVDPETGEPAFGYGWVDKIERADPTVKTPRLPQLRGMAAGLKVPLKLLQEAAAAQYLGLQQDAIWSSDLSTRLTVARMGELSPDDRAELLQMVELWTRGKTTQVPPGVDS